MTTGKWLAVMERTAIGAGQIASATVGDKEIAIYNIDGELYATDNICTHAFGLLSEGFLEGDVIECPIHAGRFEVKTGKGLGPPIICDIKTYPVRLNGDSVEVDVSD
jgi:nitrite reductase/ring-hydroxylating ferredoxin subunit